MPTLIHAAIERVYEIASTIDEGKRHVSLEALAILTTDLSEACDELHQAIEAESATNSRMFG